DEPRLTPDGERDIGQRASRDQGNLPGCRADGVDQEVHGMPLARTRRRRREARRPEPGLAMNMAGIQDRAEQRTGLPATTGTSGQPTKSRTRSALAVVVAKSTFPPTVVRPSSSSP